MRIFLGNNNRQLRYDIFMPNRSGLSVYALRLAAPVDKEYLDNSRWSNQFFYRNSFNQIIHCSRDGVKKYIA